MPAVAPILHHRGAADHFQLRDLGETIEDFIMHTVRKISVVLIRAEILERQDGNAFLMLRYAGWLPVKKKAGFTGPEEPGQKQPGQDQWQSEQSHPSPPSTAD